MRFFSIGEQIPAKRSVTFCCRCAVWALCFTSVHCARALQTSDGPPETSHVDIQTKATPPTLKHPAAASKSKAHPLVRKTQDPLYPSDAAATPATVILKDGTLTVDANNSDLSQILKDVADVSGMTINGSIRSDRVYGVYGPRSPSDVLTNLLKGSGYNFIMVGVTHEGVPRELLLTLPNGNPIPVTAPSPTVAALDRREDPDGNTRDQDHLGPGAIAHLPPDSSENPEERVQQNLQRLEQVHDQQQQQNPPQ